MTPRPTPSPTSRPNPFPVSARFFALALLADAPRRARCRGRACPSLPKPGLDHPRTKARHPAPGLRRRHQPTPFRAARHRGLRPTGAHRGHLREWAAQQPPSSCRGWCRRPRKCRPLRRALAANPGGAFGAMPIGRALPTQGADTRRTQHEAGARFIDFSARSVPTAIPANAIRAIPRRGGCAGIVINERSVRSLYRGAAGPRRRLRRRIIGGPGAFVSRPRAGRLRRRRAPQLILKSAARTGGGLPAR